MNGCIIYNHSLKSESYSENIKLFATQMDLSCYSNAEFTILLQEKYVTPNMDYCVFLDKDVNLAKHLEANGVRVYNCADAISVCDNKGYTHIAMQDKVPTPKTFIPPLSYFGTHVMPPLPFPYVIKCCYGSWGEQVYLSKNVQDTEKILEQIGNKPYIVQEYIEARGTDYRLYTVGGKVKAVMRRHNKNDFRANCELGGIAEKVTPSDEMIKIAETAASVLNLDFGGIDLIQDKNGKAYFIEANSSAQAIQLERVTGVQIPVLLKEYITNTMNKQI